jgi:hypothetical protein
MNSWIGIGRGRRVMVTGNRKVRHGRVCWVGGATHVTRRNV